MKLNFVPSANQLNQLSVALVSLELHLTSSTTLVPVQMVSLKTMELVLNVLLSAQLVKLLPLVTLAQM